MEGVEGGVGLEGGVGEEGEDEGEGGLAGEPAKERAAAWLMRMGGEGVRVSSWA